MPANYFLSAEEQQATHDALLAAQTASAARAARDPIRRAVKWREHFSRISEQAFNTELVKVLEAAESAGYVWPYR
ncbi:MAG TPA: hypothetical protein VFL96_16125 [Acidobacteriaceae bacterium]|jgi:hypothetical protein|nr:hypothetical protein [Acidobacteriaceae bacterium]